MAEPQAVGGALPNIWLPGLVERFASCLGPNFVACTLRLVDNATAEQCRGRPEYPSMVRLSQPVPPHAFAARWGAPGAMRDLTLAQRKDLLRLTAASGVAVNLEVALGAVGFIPNPRDQEGILGAAATAGQADAVHCVLGRGYSDRWAVGNSMYVAAGAGHQSVCEVLLAHDRSPGVTLDLVAAALRGGHPQLADWLLQRRREGPIGFAESLSPLGEETNSELLCAATEGCDLPTVQSFHRRCCGDALGGSAFVMGSAVLIVAAGSRTADWQAKVEWWESQLPPESLHRLYDDARVCTASARCPDAETRLAWLLGRGYSVEPSASDAALRAGNAAALELLLRRGLRPDCEATDAGRLEALIKLAEYSCPVDAAEVALAAAVGRQLPMLVWAVEELGASVQDLAVMYAAEDLCDLEALRWLRPRGCPVNGARVARSAARLGHLAALVWAAEELGAPLQTAELMDAAAASGSVEMMAWLRERGCPWGLETFGKAAGSGCEASLVWLAERGCPMPRNGVPYLAAALNCDMATLRCLMRLGCAWGPSSGAKAVFEALLNLLAPIGGHSCHLPLPVLRVLVELGCPVDWEAVRRTAASRATDVRDWLLAEAAAAENATQ
ncbi:hypothetical protein GPECTOR_25g413 [Gonium pectorale]|uniref:Ankyrin repeat domain-containing protein n=1 Tax=Gonium pectorale TaxID=33097 RepID=A0A150GG64_GONPE|nr:hypothetical protein GPECTOR_25g413 [Gonium pectorale]|eukprot:KXZ48828.1 hypothetical protein GPECTOR_25g413 [Gonium pectorale]